MEKSLFPVSLLPRRSNQLQKVNVVKRLVTQGRLVCLLYGLSGCAGLAYETVWIRAFAISFGNTVLSFSTVISVYLGGLALGAGAAGRMRTRRGLAWYGAAEIWVGLYALAIPWLIERATPLLAPLYNSSAGGWVAVSRALLSAAILLPATIPMGASLPWLAFWLTSGGWRAPRVSWIYALNTAVGAAGAVLTGLFLLPAAGYQRSVWIASGIDIVVGMVSLWLSWTTPARSVPLLEPMNSRRAQTPLGLTTGTLALVAVLSGWSVMLYEVAWSRIAGLLFGPTATTVTLTLAAVLLGLGAGAVLAAAIRKQEARWLAVSQLVVALLLLIASYGIAVSPAWLAEQIRLRSESLFQMETFEAAMLLLLLFPLNVAAGMALPLAMRLLQRDHPRRSAEGIGWLYGLNTVGCIAGALIAGWLLVPSWGTERTLYTGAMANAGLGMLALPAGSRRLGWRIAGLGIAALSVAAFSFPQWDLEAMTAGAYKYAPYYSRAAGSELHAGEILYLREGAAGTVTVRRIDRSLVLAIDGKVDATDAGGDLLTEKLLAHLPLRLLLQPRSVCVIGLASGVTAGAVLTYPVDRLDVVEVSPEVVQASHLFDRVNGRPLADRRAQLILNDGRNHLALTSRRYDAILSEPSNPWISGMNALFTRDFFRIARRALNPGGVLAQWFHLYNMPPDDLRSLLRAFTDVFPSAELWQLNDGDVLLTGYANDQMPHFLVETPPAAAAADLSAAGVAEPLLLSTLYVMRGADLARFASGAVANTDDLPVLEFHGQRDLNSQTDADNGLELGAFPKQLPLPPAIRADWQSLAPERWVERGRMFERAESYRMAFASYQKALAGRPESTDAIAGMIRSARSPEERAAAGTLESRTRQALSAAQAGKPEIAQAILQALKQAYPAEPETHFNYGLFCLERSRYEEAIGDFTAAIAANRSYVPAYEGMAEAYLRKRDFASAAEWSRRILELDPNHAVARQTLAGIEKLAAGAQSAISESARRSR